MTVEEWSIFEDSLLTAFRKWVDQRSSGMPRSVCSSSKGFWKSCQKRLLTRSVCTFSSLTPIPRLLPWQKTAMTTQKYSKSFDPISNDAFPESKLLHFHFISTINCCKILKLTYRYVHLNFTCDTKASSSMEFEFQHFPSFSISLNLNSLVYLNDSLEPLFGSIFGCFEEKTVIIQKL